MPEALKKAFKQYQIQMYLTPCLELTFAGVFEQAAELPGSDLLLPGTVPSSLAVNDVPQKRH